MEQFRNWWLEEGCELAQRAQMHSAIDAYSLFLEVWKASRNSLKDDIEMTSYCFQRQDIWN